MIRMRSSMCRDCQLLPIWISWVKSWLKDMQQHVNSRLVALRQPTELLPRHVSLLGQSHKALATLNKTAAETTMEGNATLSNNANTQSSVERSLRDAISKYFSAEDDIYISSEGQNLDDGRALPLKSAEPMLGADARALIMQINKTAQCPVGNSLTFLGSHLHCLKLAETISKALLLLFATLCWCRPKTDASLDMTSGF